MNKHPQTATLWKYDGVDINNVPTFINLGSFNVRWEEESRMIVNSDGREVLGNGTIYFPDKVFEVGYYITKGEVPDAEPPSNSYEIQNVRSISNLSGTEYEYRAMI